MSSREKIIAAHGAVGDMPANRITERLRRWYVATGKLLYERGRKKPWNKDARSTKS